ncbi:V-type ATP synthase subunit F [Bittarella massiliensis (ex Durand et al. 2017)]|uniref:V-type ATP synthase subunit F n=1 Tax=Bittarella massiliensis (ex Durand et al. 2017) TaxID=1720313 RepID=UPI001AA0E3B5|nr:V-type ATP synthase subunit F [Bittarella massiliensis (ex Durand et al. 2017)]MBO1678381.1 V-type ATP synthase subunit F [Bittarella massiliensis (ex Durand et al. 2017)]
MYKIAVMGDRDSVYGFAALGLDTYSIDDPAAAGKKLKELAGGNYAIIYMTEALFEALSEVVDRYREAPLPAIIPIPGVIGNTGIGEALVKKSVEQAVGSDILFGGDSNESKAGEEK